MYKVILNSQPVQEILVDADRVSLVENTGTYFFRKSLGGKDDTVCMTPRENTIAIIKVTK